MALTLAEKLLQAHIVPEACPDTKFTKGEKIERGCDIAIKIDQTLTQDATGTMTYLQFETIGIPRVKTELSVSGILSSSGIFVTASVLGDIIIPPS